jgi:hypothetical protein
MAAFSASAECCLLLLPLTECHMGYDKDDDGLCTRESAHTQHLASS